MALLASWRKHCGSPWWGMRSECQASVNTADAILVDNFEMNYLVFERAAEFRARHRVEGARANPGRDDPAQPNIIFAGIAHVMSRVARLESPELIPIREIDRSH